MASPQFEKSLDNDECDPYDVALARLDSIQSEYMKKLRDARDTFDNTRISLQGDIRERQREIQVLQQELQRKETGLQEKEQELKDEENKFHVRLRQEQQNRKRKLEPYLRISPAPTEQRDTESTDITRGQTEVGSPGQGTNHDAGRQLQEMIVIDSEDDSGDEWGMKPLVTSSMSPSKRPRISEVEGRDVNSSSRQRNRKRQRVRIENSSDGGECSNTAQLREDQSEAEATTNLGLLPSVLRKHDQKRKKNKSVFKGIIDPTVGGIYKIDQGLRKRSYAAILLPIGDFSAIGITKSLYDTSLRRSIPSCYIYNKTVKKILGWEKDYDDGGPRVMDRKFPVMSFDGIAEDQIRLDGEFHAVGAKYAWVSAKSIRTLELDGFIFNIVSGHDSARRFSTRLDLMKENRVKEAQQVCDRNEPPRVTSGRLSPGELRRQDTDSSQTLGHSQVLTLRYSEADLTPRQSQTAEKHDDTIHVITEPRPNSLSQRIDHEFHTFESIYRETSEPELVGSERSSDGVHNDDDRDRQLISDLFPGSPIAQVEETSDDNIASNVRHNDLVEAPSPLVKARAISGLPYVARAIRRPWSEDSGLNPSQNSSSSLVLDPTSSKTARAFYTNLKKYVNQHENDTPDYLPPTAPMLPQGLLQDHQATTELQGNRARNDELASTSNLNIQNTASTALSYFNTIYSREK